MANPNDGPNGEKKESSLERAISEAHDFMHEPALDHGSDWESYRDDVMERNEPVGLVETTLAELIALTYARDFSLSDYENDLSSARVEQSHRDMALVSLWPELATSREEADQAKEYEKLSNLIYDIEIQFDGDPVDAQMERALLNYRERLEEFFKMTNLSRECGEIGFNSAVHQFEDGLEMARNRYTRELTKLQKLKRPPAKGRSSRKRKGGG